MVQLSYGGPFFEVFFAFDLYENAGAVRFILSQGKPVVNILHVLSGDFVTGSETSTAALIEQQVKAGHQVLIAAGSFSQPTKARLVPVPIYDRGFFQRLFNTGSLVKIIRREKIDIVHAHSRAASWVCHWACRLTKTAYLSTLHGRQHLHLSNRRHNVYGPRVIAVCENIREQMLKETSVFEPEQLVVIRNGLNLTTGRE